MMDYFEAVARRQHTRDMEAEGNVADNMGVRLAIVARIQSGEVTLEEGQRELAAIKRQAKQNGQVTRNQAFLWPHAMTTPTDELRAIAEAALAEIGTLPLSEEWMYHAIRHCQRNEDFELEMTDGNEPDRYAGTLLAKLANSLPAILALLDRLAALEADNARLQRRASDLERGPLYKRPAYDCGVCTTPTTCAMHGRCMPIIGEASGEAFSTRATLAKQEPGS